MPTPKSVPLDDRALTPEYLVDAGDNQRTRLIQDLPALLSLPKIGTGSQAPTFGNSTANPQTVDLYIRTLSSGSVEFYVLSDSSYHQIGGGGSSGGGSQPTGESIAFQWRSYNSTDPTSSGSWQDVPIYAGVAKIFNPTILESDDGLEFRTPDSASDLIIESGFGSSFAQEYPAETGGSTSWTREDSAGFKVYQLVNLNWGTAHYRVESP